MSLFIRIAGVTRRIRLARASLPIVVLLATAALTSAPVQAQPNSPQAPWVVANVQTAAPGDRVSFSAVGFAGGTPITFKLSQPGSVVLGTLAAAGDGIAVLTVNVPIDTPLGDRSVSASGIDPNGRALAASAPLAIATRVVDLHAALVRTRSSVSVHIAPAGLVTLSGAALLLLVVRKRRSLTG